MYINTFWTQLYHHSWLFA